MSTGEDDLVICDQANRPNAATLVVHVGTKLQGPSSDTLKFLGAEVRDYVTPLRNRGRAYAERPGDIRGTLKVIHNGLFQHELTFTRVKEQFQPRCQSMALTSVDMDKLATIADRLRDAIKQADTYPSALAHECRVSPAAVKKWLDGGKMNADNSDAASRALGVREEWLRTGRLPRERDGAEEDSQAEKVLDILEDLRAPLAALSAAIETLSKTRTQPRKRKSQTP